MQCVGLIFKTFRVAPLKFILETVTYSPRKCYYARYVHVFVKEENALQVA